ncbi:hypothetical protein FB567DRAFT_248336 [Paraphoma chrysanthemicola]|uniref:Uncharacterized protein n=1 Tax=Paraphoma chrysanthemicola TaxID=798071 RepID=A0A8K0QT85_9PLEO|nr:hypothetical protein FB567DRAFT_248336 [Paraphoma chrysanthemicola]
MLTIPLNFTWDWKTNIIINAQAKNVTNPSTGTLPPSQIRGHMFHGPANVPEVYVYGGTTYMGNQTFEAYAWPDSSAYPLWSYTQGPNYPWGQYAVSTPWMPNHGAAAEAIDQGLAFYLNGQIDWGTSSKTRDTFKTEELYVPVKGMVILDLKTQSSRNISTTMLRGGAPRIGGSLEYIASVGGMGSLVALGGQIQPNLAGLYANVSEGQLIDFSMVDVFDIESYLNDPSSNGSWYAQNTTGDVPEPRIDFCTVAISAPDNSSHHIYMYGGIDPITGVGYDDVLILTLPSFTWTNVWPIGEAPRWGHKCHIAGKRQMITVGGNITNGLECDWEVKGVAVWELSTLTWGSVFMSNLSTFQVPQKVLPLTNGTVNGSATVKEPALGWTDPGLKTVFATRRKDTSTGGTKKTNTAAIAGGVVGGIVALALIAILALFLRRRHRKAHAPHELPNTPSAAAAHRELGHDEKYRNELAAVNQDDPAELTSGHELRELESPREAVEADPMSQTGRAELPGTSTAPGAVHGVPIVRTPGDDLPELPVYFAGVRRPSQESEGRGGIEGVAGGKEEKKGGGEPTGKTLDLEKGVKKGDGRYTKGE